MKKILITGGAGFIGSNLAIKLIHKGYEINVLDCLSEQVHGIDPENTSPLYNAIKDKVNFIKGSVTSKSDLIKAISEVDVIIHLAAETGTGQSMYQIKKYSEVNILGTALLLELMVNHDHKVQKLIIASSRSIYGEGKYLSNDLDIVYPLQRSRELLDQCDFEVKHPGCRSLKALPTDEESMLHPSSIYGVTKLSQEKLVVTVCQSIKLPFIALRYHNVYGPGQSLNNPYTGIIPLFYNRIRNIKPINVFEDGKGTRDFVYIDDAVDATIMSIENNSANNQILNVGSGISTSIIKVAELLVELCKKEIPIEISGNYRIGDIRHSLGDISKINKLLNFVPKVSFEVGIRNYKEWVDSQSLVKDKYFESQMEMKRKGFTNFK